MRLAADEITIRLDGETLFLRPTLRAAFRLERRYGFPKLIAAITEGNVTIMAEVIRESGGEYSSLPGIIEAIGRMGYRHGITALTAPLLDHVLALAGHGDSADSPAADQPPGERIPFAEYHARLFRIATGWLGWTPETTWNATAGEILEAYAGRVEMLKTIFGSSEETPTSGASVHSEQDVSGGIATLKMLVAQGANVRRG